MLRKNIEKTIDSQNSYGNNEAQHILLNGTSTDSLDNAVSIINSIFFADDETLKKFKSRQNQNDKENGNFNDLLEILRKSAYYKQQTDIFKNNTNNSLTRDGKIPDHLMTPYGPPGRDARIIEIPDNVLGLVIGKQAATVKRLVSESGCKIKIANAKTPGTEKRNIFIEGSSEGFSKAKYLIDELIHQNKPKIVIKSHTGISNPFLGPYTYLKIPNHVIGLIIGKSGETINRICNKTNCFVFIPKECLPGEKTRELQLSGSENSVKECSEEINSLVYNKTDAPSGLNPHKSEAFNYNNLTNIAYMDSINQQYNAFNQVMNNTGSIYNSGLTANSSVAYPNPNLMYDGMDLNSLYSGNLLLPGPMNNTYINMNMSMYYPYNLTVPDSSSVGNDYLFGATTSILQTNNFNEPQKMPNIELTEETTINNNSNELTKNTNQSQSQLNEINKELQNNLEEKIYVSNEQGDINTNDKKLLEDNIQGNN